MGWHIALVAVCVLSIVNALFIVVLFRQVGQAYLGYRPARARDGLPLGTEVPQWSGETAASGTIGRDAFGGRPHVILFAEPDCAPCRRLMPEFVRAEAALLDAGVPAVIIGSEEAEENDAFVAQYGISSPVVTHTERAIAHRMRVFATPWAYGVDEDGRITWKGFVNSSDEIEALVSALTGGEPRSTAMVTAAHAPTTNGGGP